MYFYIIVAIQAYCIYHAYKNRKPYYWYFLIFFIPAIGSLIYLITQVYNKNDVDKIQDDLTTVLNPTKKLKELEKKIDFIDTYTNRIELADSYFRNNDITNAIENYKVTLKDTVQDDLYAREQLILCYSEIEDYPAVIEQAELIKNRSQFKGSRQQFFYGLALKETGKIDDAEFQLKQIDRPYSNYAERLELAKIYLETDRQKEGEELLNEIYAESQNMTKTNKSLYRATIAEVERLLK